MRKKNEFTQLDDRELLLAPGPGLNTSRAVREFATCATILLFVLSEAAVVAVMLWQGWGFAFWPFVVVPVVAWSLLLAGPMFVKFRAGSLALLDAAVKTAEAYAARAGYVVDLNSDGVIGHRVPQIQSPVEEYRPLIVRGRVAETHKALPAPYYADAAPDAVGGSGALDVAQEPDPVRVKVWHLPNRERIEQGELESFVDGVFTLGWSREVWLSRGMTRPVYDGCIALLESADILADRKPGFCGRLTLRNARQARAVLDLPVKSG